MTASSEVLESNVATGDSTAWSRLRSSGMVLLGHAHADEFAFGSATAQTGNPWDPTKSSGGSSGGSAALLGARSAAPASWTSCGLGALVKDITLPAVPAGMLPATGSF